MAQIMECQALYAGCPTNFLKGLRDRIGTHGPCAGGAALCGPRVPTAFAIV